MIVTRIEPDKWAKISETAHKVVFNEVRPSEMDRVSYALVVGTEATGLSEKWRTESTKNIIIPMQGEIDSMNVSAAAAILLFEAKRQRQFQ